jgi:hypothetical protein
MQYLKYATKRGDICIRMYADKDVAMATVDERDAKGNRKAVGAYHFPSRARMRAWVNRYSGE